MALLSDWYALDSVECNSVVPEESERIAVLALNAVPDNWAKIDGEWVMVAQDTFPYLVIVGP